MDAKVELIGKEILENAKAIKVSYEGEGRAIIKLIAFTIREIAQAFEEEEEHEDMLEEVIIDLKKSVDLILEQRMGGQS